MEIGNKAQKHYVYYIKTLDTQNIQIEFFT